MVAIICIGYSTEGYWEMWIVENAWLFVVQFKLRKEHIWKQTSDNIIMTVY